MSSCLVPGFVPSVVHTFCISALQSRCPRQRWRVRTDRGHVGTKLKKTSDVKLQALCLCVFGWLGGEQGGKTTNQHIKVGKFCFCALPAAVAGNWAIVWTFLDLTFQNSCRGLSGGFVGEGKCYVTLKSWV